LQTKIKLKLKTFLATRKIYEIEMEITDSIDKLKEKLIQADESKEIANCKQIRIIYPIVPILFNLFKGKNQRVFGIIYD
jgi:hypothetical protein